MVNKMLFVAVTPFLTTRQFVSSLTPLILRTFQQYTYHTSNLPSPSHHLGPHPPIFLTLSHIPSPSHHLGPHPPIFLTLSHIPSPSHHLGPHPLITSSHHSSYSSPSHHLGSHLHITWAPTLPSPLPIPSHNLPSHHLCPHHTCYP